MKNSTTKKRLATLILFILIAFLPSATAVFVKPDGWYGTLLKPAWTPPGWIFGPVWTFLYCTIGIAGFIAWMHSRSRQRFFAFTLFGLQLISNALWTVLFFQLHSPLFALIDILILLTLIIALIGVFYSISKKAAFFLLPYAIWVVFASYLNIMIFLMN